MFENAKGRWINYLFIILHGSALSAVKQQNDNKLKGLPGPLFVILESSNTPFCIIEFEF
jgi:hypothetical protein